MPSQILSKIQNNNSKLDLIYLTPGANFGAETEGRRFAEISSERAPELDYSILIGGKLIALANAYGAQSIALLGNGKSLLQKQLHMAGLKCHTLEAVTDNNAVINFDDLASIGPVLLVSVFALESLYDPRPLLAQVRSYLLSNKDARFLTFNVSVPNVRDSQEQPKVIIPSHFREWSSDGAVELIKNAGLNVEDVEILPAQGDFSFELTLINSNITADIYFESLAHAGLIESSSCHVQHIFLTTEYPVVVPSGGIGTFVHEQVTAYGKNRSLVLLESFGQLDPKKAREAGIVTHYDLFRDDYTSGLSPDDRALESLLHLLFYFPDLKSVQFQDYMGIGARIGQAKRAGILPHTLTVIIHCHGALHYLEHGHRHWFPRDHRPVAERERVALNSADTVCFPSKFLFRLYERCGLIEDDARARIIPYPYAKTDYSLQNPYQRAHTLIYVGKRSKMKGFSIFIEAVLKSKEVLRLNGIDKIVLIGPIADIEDQMADSLVELQQAFHLETQHALTRDNLRAFLFDRAASSLVVLPYLEDNYPLTVYDVLATNSVALLSNGGGMREMTPVETPNGNDIYFSPTVAELSLALERGAKWNSEDRYQIARFYADFLIDRQEAIITSYKTLSNTQSESKLNCATSTIVIPVYNTDLPYVVELISAINNQSRQPDEVIVVDDCSEFSYSEELKKVVSLNLNAPHRIIRHEFNKGLAGARNTALNACSTDILMNLDSDDIPLNSFVNDIVSAFEHDPRATAVVPYLAAWQDGDVWNRAITSNDYVYRPLGSGLIAALKDNILGHANSGFRVSDIRPLGGWDQRDKSKWEDWGLFLTIVGSGLKILVRPQVSCLYRVRKNSMARTYDSWDAQIRIANALPRLEKFEAYSLLSMAYGEQRLVEQVASLNARIEHLTGQLNLHGERPPPPIRR